MRIVALLVLLGVALSPISARADDIATAQGVIRAQEQAFGHDDAAAAYSYAAPAIREIFPAPDIFMSMVQNGYAPVYRDRSFEFADSETKGNWIGQRVRIIDANGDAWVALYTLEQQADGSYKIPGCSLLKA